MKKRNITKRILDLHDYLMLQKYYYYRQPPCQKIADHEYDAAEHLLEKLMKENPQVKVPRWQNVLKQVDSPNPKWIDYYNLKLDKYIQRIGAWKDIIKTQ